MSNHAYTAFKTAGEGDAGSEEPEETAEDFGIDPDEAIYTYDTGRRSRCLT